MNELLEWTGTARLNENLYTLGWTQERTADKPACVDGPSDYCTIQINSAVTRHRALKIAEISQVSHPFWQSAETILRNEKKTCRKN